MVCRFRALALAALGLTALLLSGRLVAATDPALVDVPVYSGDELLLPSDYQEWVFVGGGATVAPDGHGRDARPRMLTSTFAAPRAYRHFLRTGRWPDGTVLVHEVRGAVPDGPVSPTGYHVAGVLGTQVAVKDEVRFGAGWRYFAFGAGDLSAAPTPTDAACSQCHRASGAVDDTFVQFYPTLRAAARRHGVLRSSQDGGE